MIETAIGWTGTALVFAGLVVSLRHGEKSTTYGLFALGWWVTFISRVLDPSPLWTSISGLLAVLYTYLWWRNRRGGRGRKTLRELGAKSRARVEALARNMTPSPIPSPAGGRA